MSGSASSGLSLVPPNVSLRLSRMAEAKPPSLIRSKGKYKLHRREMTELDRLYAAHPTTIAASKLLTDLPAQLPDLAERAFPQEAINCYRVRAYRASIVMTWNLAYDHLIQWIFADPSRIAALNGAFAKRFQKKPITVNVPQDLEDIKEFDVVEFVRYRRAGLDQCCQDLEGETHEAQYGRAPINRVGD